MHPTKQVQSTNFQLNTKPMLAMNYAANSFRQLERLVRLRFADLFFIKIIFESKR
jgi:hypothetical protein